MELREVEIVQKASLKLMYAFIALVVFKNDFDLFFSFDILNIFKYIYTLHTHTHYKLPCDHLSLYYYYLSLYSSAK